MAQIQLEAASADATELYLRSHSSGPARTPVPVVVPGPGSACTATWQQLQVPPGNRVRLAHVHCPTGARGQLFSVQGLGRQLPDAIVRVNLGEDGNYTYSLNQHHNNFELASPPRPPALPRYLPLGLQHILGGIDHLLFVALLCLLLRGWLLLIALSLFTVAHSLTLALVMLGSSGLPRTPVEACIALSLALLAAEALRRPEAEPLPSSARRPGTLVFLFGLLHGLGFAGALADQGLPTGAALPALLLFNLGIELGQLLFVAALLLLLGLARWGLPSTLLARARVALLYTVGSGAIFWTLLRIVPGTGLN